MHQSFVSTAPLGPGISGAFNFSIFKALLKALLSGAKIVVKSLLKAPALPGLTIMKNNKTPEPVELTLFACHIVIPHKLWVHWSCGFREKFEHTYIHRQIHTFTRKHSVLNICTCPYILVYQTKQLRVVPDIKIHGNDLNVYMCVYICELNKNHKSNINLKNTGKLFI